MNPKTKSQIDAAGKSIPNWIIVAALFIVPVATFVIDKGSAIISRNELIATKPYVDDKAAEVTAAAKLREQALFEKAVEHSDRNHDDVISRMKDQSSDIRAVSIKVDAIRDQINVNHIEAIRDRDSEREQRKRSK